ncbi:hypothetical protein BSKO_08566 [Bryopsis sp. KO-2023]|nr:hypothetical protein BSKO_08566 [Bryopsis sp. KO-2023]
MLASLGRVLLGSEASLVNTSRSWLIGASCRSLCDTTDKNDSESNPPAESTGEEGEAEVTPTQSGEAPEQVEGEEGLKFEDQISYYEAWHRPGRYPSRAEIGNYSDSGTLDTEMLLDWETRGDGPKGVRLYDLPKWLRHNKPEDAPRPRIKGLLAQALEDKDIQELHDYFLAKEEEFRETESPSIFKWEIQFVLSVGGEDHPANRKVKLRVYMTELQEHYGLDDEAVQHICRICQTRYNPSNGMLTLSVEKYPLREDNRRECMRIVEALVLEGMRKSPGITEDGYLKTDPFEAEGESEESKAGGEGQTMSM